ncbi:hypothetical protein PMAYCL1PPCAC_27551, partial [Pristionchus mayeri]
WVTIKASSVEINDKVFRTALPSLNMITAQDQGRMVLGPILAKLDAAIQSGNLDEIIKFYSPDATIVIKGTQAAPNIAEIKEALAPYTAPADVKLANPTFEATSEHIIYRAHFHSTIKADGNVFQGKTGSIWRKENGQYKCMHEEISLTQ